MRGRTKYLTVSAMLAALGVILLGLGSLINTLDLTVAALASILCVWAVIEMGKTYAWMIWLVTSFLAILLLPQKTPGCFYLFIGLYPILKERLERLPRAVRVVEMASNDAWIRDCGPTFLVNDRGGLRAVDWTFNAWGGLVDGLYFPWDLDDQVAQKVCELERVDSYRTEGFVLEGGSIHVDGEGTVLTTEMCLLSEGRNPSMDRGAIEHMLCDYLGCEKVLWLRDGIDPDETNGHIDDVACFIRPGEVACIWTDDPQNPFYQPAHDAYDTLSQATDARGRRLKVHKLCLTQRPCLLEGAATIDAVEGTIPRTDGEVAIASYMNFLIVNGGIILPQYGDENDALAVQQVQAMFPERRVVGVQTREVAFGGGNIHCITQQQPAPQRR